MGATSMKRMEVMQIALQHRSLLSLASAALLLVVGCTSTLVEDPERQVSTETTRCSGSETVDNSSVAVLPIPIVAFFVPHADLNKIKADEYIRRCGEPTTLVNRKVEINRTACIPAGLTRIVTLGVWQWCPSRVSWEADVVQ